MASYMKRDPNKKQIKAGFSFDEDVIQLLDEMAIEWGTSRTGVIQKLVRECKETNKKKGV